MFEIIVQFMAADLQLFCVLPPRLFSYQVKIGYMLQWRTIQQQCSQGLTTIQSSCVHCDFHKESQNRLLYTRNVLPCMSWGSNVMTVQHGHYCCCGINLEQHQGLSSCRGCSSTRGCPSQR